MGFNSVSFHRETGIDDPEADNVSSIDDAIGILSKHGFKRVKVIEAGNEQDREVGRLYFPIGDQVIEAIIPKGLYSPQGDYIGPQHKDL